MVAVDTEAALSRFLRDLPHFYGYRYSPDVARILRKHLFLSLVLGQASNLPLLFRSKHPEDPEIDWSVTKAQGGHEGAEYTAAARGHACGHIFKSGESSYHCKTCAADDTCVLCARCFHESDHEGHAVFVSVSAGNSGCCDCGDEEAWVRPVKCAIHTATGDEKRSARGKAPLPAGPAPEIAEAIRVTISKVLDYVCDVFACSPEQLRDPKTEQSVIADELQSRLSVDKYGISEREKVDVEYCLILWNDEKHTVDQVRDQLARACKKPKTFGTEKAIEIDSVGRSVIEYSHNLPLLLEMARVLEQIKVSVSIRATRDIFREQMCETIIDWLSDVHGCSVGGDPNIFRDILCAELFNPWQVGSPKHNAEVAKNGIYDHETSEREWHDLATVHHMVQIVTGDGRMAVVAGDDDHDWDEDDDENDENDDNDEGDEMDEDGDEGDEGAWNGLEDALEDMDPGERNRMVSMFERTMNGIGGAGAIRSPNVDSDTEMADLGDEDQVEAMEATLADYLPPAPPPTGHRSMDTTRQGSMSDGQSGVLGSHTSDEQDSHLHQPPHGLPKLPRTPKARRGRAKGRPSQHWLVKPTGWVAPKDLPPRENLKSRLRIDCLILFDLRLWKTLRDSLRFLYIGAVITVPEYKRLLGIRFAGLYSLLAQLYLVADREPDHSIINLSLQLLTTPSITAEIVEKANFLTHLIAIMYTFLTTREVKYPEGVQSNATLSFESGAVTNRRMFHFFIDARYIFQAASVQERVRSEPQFLLQFLDLVKLHQGINPNLRAVGEHVEYEADTWVGLAMVTKEISRLSKLMADSFLNIDLHDADHRDQVSLAIRTVLRETMALSLGLEPSRFAACEVREPLKFMTFKRANEEPINLPNVRVCETHMSFQHPLHNVTSWMLQAAQTMSRETIQQLFTAVSNDIHARRGKSAASAAEDGPFSSGIMPYDYWSALFDKPLRMVVWLAQMRAGLWVRNGMNLRHQMHAYRNPGHRDVSFQRDLYMLQAGLVLVGPETTNIGERFLIQILARFDMYGWLNGDFAFWPEYDDARYMDMVEDFFHLLVILISDREDLHPTANFGKPSEKSIQRDIAHVLCFKPLSYSELTNRMTERIYDSETFDDVLEEMTNYKAPEGLSDSGTYQLRPALVEMVDPYYPYYGRNHREEADTICREYWAKKQGIDKSQAVPEPMITPIQGGLFERLADFVLNQTFAQLVANALKFATQEYATRKIDISRVEPWLNVVLHLMLIAVKEDVTAKAAGREPGFVDRFLEKPVAGDVPIMTGLKAVLSIHEFASCHPRVRLIMKRVQEARPCLFSQDAATEQDTNMDSSNSQGAIDKEAKKKAALARQAKVMAQFKAQQSSFMSNHGIDWGDDDMTDDEMKEGGQDAADNITETEKERDYPADACILCQEEANEERLYGCFACITPTNIQRQTPQGDKAWVQEVVDTPLSLDRSAEAIRPFGHASRQKIGHSHDRSSLLANGFDHYDSVLKDHVITSCGHMMHFSCFETYLAATLRRQSTQISRNHPERLDKKEFLCPLCKALGNMFLPVIWKSRKEFYPGVLSTGSQSWEEWMEGDIKELETRLQLSGVGTSSAVVAGDSKVALARDYVQKSFQPGLSGHVLDATSTTSPFADSDRSMASRAFGSLFLGNGRIISSFTSSPTSLGASVNAELHKAYQLLNSVITANTRTADGLGTPELLDTLVQTIGSTIAATEIQHRGVESEGCLLTTIPEQTLSSLRILCETASSMQALSLVRGMGPGPANKLETCSLSHLLGLEDPISLKKHHSRNVFWSLSAASLLLGNDWQRHGHNLLRLALLAEICKTIRVYTDMAIEDISWDASRPEDPAFTRFCQTLGQSVHGKQSRSRPVSPWVQHAVERQALVFLRKAAILFHVRSGVDFAAASSSLDPRLSELDRLLVLLRLPPLATFYSFPMPARLAAHVSSRTPMLDHPAIFELVGLPHTFDALTEAAVRSRCPTTGKPPTDPVVCLFCGEIFCSQASCCRKDGIGGAGQHLAKCGGSVGLFVNIRKCMTVFLHERHGSFAAAPYLDRHGEADPTLRRHQQLFLNRKRYDRLLREVWLSHGVQSVVSRRLEGDVNNGGWETL